MISGADEAGKGALYGPGVLAIVSIEQQQLEILCKKWPIRDSKLLSRTTILNIYKNTCNFIKHKFVYLTPREIDNKNLNTLLIEKYAEIVSDIPGKITIDCPIHDPLKFNRQIYKISKVRIQSKHRADAQFKEVGLASIFAKARRQLLVKQIIENTGIDIGSGYPSDPKTRYCYQNHRAELAQYQRTKWNIKS